jgi:hypothetical protein
MFIVPDTKRNRLKPRRGGMFRPGAGHAATTELERLIVGGVAIDMSLLRSWAWVASWQRRDRGRPKHPLHWTGSSRLSSFQWQRP